MRRVDGAFAPEETDSIYVGEEDRYVVSMIVGYSDDDLEDPYAEVMDPDLAFEGEPPEWAADSAVLRAKAAANAALDLTRDGGSGDTVWFVYDRQTKEMHEFEQGDFEAPR